MKNLTITQRSEYGFTMIELMIVLALAAIATVIGISLYNSNSAQTEIEREVRNMNSLVPLVKQTFMTAQGNYEGLSNTVMLNSKSFPQGMRVGTSDLLIRHSWNQDGVELTPVNFFGTDDDSFTITYKSVPAQACQDLMSRVYKFFELVEINGNKVENVGQISIGCGTSGNATIVVTTR